MTPTTLRAAIYQTLDHVLETGEAVAIERRGQRILMVRDHAASRLARLVPHPGTINGDPAELPGITWEDAWRADDP